ncbi:hypothetical protein HZC53_04850 [Candidatus Uhrbacteria bacterium]|nr:hypothetical protein [Candidatus Uhrbacteria bacterium]
MPQVCPSCKNPFVRTAVEVTVKVRRLTYSAFVQGRTCQRCRETRIDPNELTAFKVGMAMRAVDRGRLTGRTFSYCRKALHLSAAEVARSFNISVECLLALEDTGIPVPIAMHRHMAERISQAFKALTFTPRFALDEEGLQAPALAVQN